MNKIAGTKGTATGGRAPKRPAAAGCFGAVAGPAGRQKYARLDRSARPRRGPGVAWAQSRSLDNATNNVFCPPYIRPGALFPSYFLLRLVGSSAYGFV